MQPRLEPRPLAAIYLLGEAGEARIAQLQGLEAAEAIFANTYRGAYVTMAGNPRGHWSACLKLVRSTPVFLVERRLGFDRIDEQSFRILAHAEALAVQGLAALVADP